MEIYTTNLLAFSLQETRLQVNFQVIATTLKELQQQVANLNSQHDTIMQSIIQNKHLIDSTKSQTQNNNNLLQQHNNWIKQLNSQFSFDNSLFQEPQENLTHESQNNMKKQQIRQKNTSEAEKAKESKTEKININKSQKNSFQQMILSLRDRLEILEKDKQTKDNDIEQIKKMLIGRGKNQQKRISTMSREYVSKNSGSKKDIKLEMMSIELKENEEKKAENEELAQRNPSREKTDDPILCFGNNMELDIEDTLFRLCKDFEKMKEAFAEKNRILDAHMKENHQKVQNIEKNMDILERSHDMLKYDFERTSTSFSKTRSNDTQQKAKRVEEKLNDTRITNKEYYQEKLVELFNQMDFLKGQYFELQTKLEKDEQDDSQEDQNERKVRIANKLLQKQNDESLRKDMHLHRLELKKLRNDFQEFTLAINTGTNEVKTIIIKPNENKQDWKSLSTKMQKLKTDVQSGIRQLEGKIVTSNDMIVGLNQLEIGIEQCKLLIKKKVEINDFEKAIKRVEARLNNFIIQIYEKQGNEAQFDAAIAKQPWFCLSCDSQLKTYGGKIQKPNAGDKLVGRKVNPESHMVRRNENGRLPSVIK